MNVPQPRTFASLQALYEFRREHAINVVREHGLTDDKGRSIGGWAWIAPYAHYVTAGVPWRQWEFRGEWGVQVQPTRNEKDFGATTKFALAGTLEQARRMADKKLAAQRARYEKIDMRRQEARRNRACAK